MFCGTSPYMSAHRVGYSGERVVLLVDFGIHKQHFDLLGKLFGVHVCMCMCMICMHEGCVRTFMTIYVFTRVYDIHA